MVDPPITDERGDGSASPGAIGLGGDADPTRAPIEDEGCLLQGPPHDSSWIGREHRRLERFQVQASRPIALRLLDERGQPEGLWLLADILDISRGGLCILLSGPLQLRNEQALQLDVRSHPSFGTLRLEADVRWCSCSSSFTTIGVAFRQTLPEIPRLALERRSVRRDPNTEPWALE
ncbi:MAG: PilZ domain-containing protein [Cyanobium sp.]